MKKNVANYYYILGLLLAKGKIQTNQRSSKLNIILEIRFNKPSDKSLRSDNKHNELFLDEGITMGRKMYDYILPDIIRLWNILKDSFPDADVLLEHIPEPIDDNDFSKKIVRWIIKDVSKTDPFIELFWRDKRLNKPSDLDEIPIKIKELQKDAFENKIDSEERLNIKSFMLGISDSAAIIPGPESAAFGSKGTQRIQIEVDQSRWKLNITMLVFLQEVLLIPVMNINWPHPTIKARKKPKVIFKHNHQFRAHLWSYKNLGFDISIKKRAFDIIIKNLEKKYLGKELHVKFHPHNRRNNKFVSQKEYINKFPNVNGLTTTPYKCSKHYEGSELLPPEIRGKHYAEWRDINFDLGDPYLKDYPSSLSKNEK
jgi:hypothetical protein